ncbi:MAG: 16S rRNA (uracil1498-N3)-methyltransferase [Myxococcota bacterium]
MSARRLFIDASLPSAGGPIQLNIDQWHYLHRVLRLTAHDEIEVRDGHGGAHQARISGNAELLLGPRFELPTAAEPAIRLCFAPSKGKRFDYVLEKAAEIGATVLQPIITGRTVRKPDGSARARWNRIASEAARQSGAAHLPEVYAPVPLSEAVDATGGLALIARPGATLPIGVALDQRALVSPPLTASPAPPELISIFTGPEGGFTDAELAQADLKGFVAVSLGSRILRAETAPIVALTLALARLGRID